MALSVSTLAIGREEPGDGGVGARPDGRGLENRREGSPRGRWRTRRSPCHQVLKKIAAPDVHDERQLGLGRHHVGEILIGRDAQVDAAGLTVWISAGMTYWYVCSLETRFSDRNVPFGSDRLLSNARTPRRRAAAGSDSGATAAPTAHARRRAARRRRGRPRRRRGQRRSRPTCPPETRGSEVPDVSILPHPIVARRIEPTPKVPVAR